MKPDFNTATGRIIYPTGERHRCLRALPRRLGGYDHKPERLTTTPRPAEPPGALSRPEGALALWREQEYLASSVPLTPIPVPVAPPAHHREGPGPRYTLGPELRLHSRHHRD